MWSPSKEPTKTANGWYITTDTDNTGGTYQGSSVTTWLKHDNLKDLDGNQAKIWVDSNSESKDYPGLIDNLPEPGEYMTDDGSLLKLVVMVHNGKYKLVWAETIMYEPNTFPFNINDPLHTMKYQKKVELKQIK